MSASLKSVDVITLFVDDRTASFTDPGGHIWEIAQQLPRAGG